MWSSQGHFLIQFQLFPQPLHHQTTLPALLPPPLLLLPSMNRRRPSSSLAEPPKKAGRDKAMKDLATAAAAAAAMEEDNLEAEAEAEGVEENEKKLRRPSSSSSSSAVAAGVARRGSGSGGGGGGGGSVAPSQPCCQAEKCTADLTDAKRYHRRHKVCEMHSKSAIVMVAGLRQRFCQQCSRFHELSEFDDTKRSCRRRLAGHNQRRRKSSTDVQGEESSLFRQADQEGRIQISLPEGSAFKHFQIT